MKTRKWKFEVEKINCNVCGHKLAATKDNFAVLTDVFYCWPCQETFNWLKAEFDEKVALNWRVIVQTGVKQRKSRKKKIARKASVNEKKRADKQKVALQKKRKQIKQKKAGRPKSKRDLSRRKRLLAQLRKSQLKVVKRSKVQKERDIANEGRGVVMDGKAPGTVRKVDR